MRKAILVTGIGHYLAYYLAERGHLVYTAVRKDADFAASSWM